MAEDSLSGESPLSGLYTTVCTGLFIGACSHEETESSVSLPLLIRALMTS